MAERSVAHRRPLPWRTQINVALARWQNADTLSAERKGLARETRAAFQLRLKRLDEALALLRDELLDASCIIGVGLQRRRAARALSTLIDAMHPWIDRYQPAPGRGRGGARRGQGRRPNPFLDDCRRIARLDDVGYEPVARYLANLQGRMTPDDRRRIFQTEKRLAWTTLRARLYRPPPKNPSR